MLNAALLAALLAITPAHASDSVRVGTEDLARGFGQPTERLVKAVGQLEELGLPVQMQLRLSQADGRPAAGTALTAAWLKDSQVLKTDAEGRATLRLDASRLDTLELSLPAGLRAEVGIDYLDAVGLKAYCPETGALVRAAGC